MFPLLFNPPGDSVKPQQVSTPAEIFYFMQGRGGISLYGGGPERLLSEGKGANHRAGSCQWLSASAHAPAMPGLFYLQLTVCDLLTNQHVCPCS